MTGSAGSAKSALRSDLRDTIRKLTGDRAPLSCQLCDHVAAHPAWKTASAVLLYSPLRGEPDVSPLIHQALKDGKLVAIPSFLGSAQAYGARQISHPELDFVQGPFGTREPAQNQPEVLLKQLDLALVPGLGFDARGRRLGRGKGFYDRILAQVAGLKWGVAWDEQIVDEVPVESHDVILDCVVTPTRWLCRSRV